MPYKIKSNGQWTGQWMAQVREGEKTFNHRSKSKKEALLWEQEKRELLLNPQVLQLIQAQTHTVSLAEWATAYLDHCKKTFVAKTYGEKCHAFRELFKALDPDLPCTDLTPGMVLEHLQDENEKRSGYGANKSRKNMRAAWEWGVTFKGLPEKNPFQRVPRFAEIRDERVIPTMDDFQKVYDLIDNDSDRCMLFAFLHTGARRDELFRLKWKDVDLNENRVRLMWRKNAIGEWKESWLSIGEELATMLDKQRRVTGLLGFVFMWQSEDGSEKWQPYLYRQHWLRKLCARAGVKQFGFHGIRHLFASILAAKGVALVEIQHRLRHSSIQTTAKYIHSLQKGSQGTVDALPSMEKDSEKRKSHQRAISGN